MIMGNSYPRRAVAGSPAPRPRSPSPRPRTRTPRVQNPANDNFPGFPPKKPRGFPKGLLSPGAVGAMIISGALDFAIWLALRDQVVARGNWYKAVECNNFPDGGWDVWHHVNELTCTTLPKIGQSAGVTDRHTSPEDALAHSPAAKSLSLWRHKVIESPYFERRWLREVWRRDTVTAEPPPLWVRGVLIPIGDLPPLPVIDPALVPPGAPIPTPKPRVRPRGRRRYNPETPVVPRPREEPQPLARPGRPTKGTKERKVAVNGQVRKWLGWLVSTASEFGDFLDALHDALPKDLQAENGTMKDKFDAVYRNLDKVDMLDAVQNLVENQVTDKYYADVFEKFQKGLDQFGIEVTALRL